MFVDQLLSPGPILLAGYVGSAAYVHFRGKVRHRLKRQLTDHSTFMAPYNCFVYLFSRVPNRPVQDIARFPELLKLRENWQVIRDEALRLYEAGHIRKPESHNDIAFNSFFKRGWTRFYLKWYDDLLPSAADLCPRTAELVQSAPSINAALFAVLPARSKLGAHRDPFAGSLRYHLGLKTPNSDACRIYIDGEPHAWRDGQDILFDETYIHSVKNDTDDVRVILFCDVERPMFPVARAVNRFVSRHVVKITSAQNVPTEKVGVVNRFSRHVFAIKSAGERLKAHHRAIYRLVSYGFTAGLLTGMAMLFLWKR